MIPIMDPEDDYLTIAAAEEQMAMTHESRQKDMHDAHVKVKRESHSQTAEGSGSHPCSLAPDPWLSSSECTNPTAHYVIYQSWPANSKPPAPPPHDPPPSPPPKNTPCT